MDLDAAGPVKYLLGIAATTINGCLRDFLWSQSIGVYVPLLGARVLAGTHRVNRLGARSATVSTFCSLGAMSWT
jgi:hypothetical protein